MTGNPHPYIVGEVSSIEYLDEKFTSVFIRYGGLREPFRIKGEVRQIRNKLSVGEMIKAYMDGTFEKIEKE